MDYSYIFKCVTVSSSFVIFGKPNLKNLRYVATRFLQKFMIFHKDVCKAYKIVGKTDIGDEICLQARGRGGSCHSTLVADVIKTDILN